MNINNSPINSNQINNNVKILDGDQASIVDIGLFNMMNRSDFLEEKILEKIDKIKQVNDLIERLESLKAKVRIAENGSANYTSPTWNINENSIRLSNGYNLEFDQKPTGVLLTINDNSNNQMLYQNGVLAPTPAGKAIDVLEVGIPVMSDTSLVLEDGTTITFTAKPLEGAFNPDDLTGGLATVSKITIQRGNQSLEILNPDTPNFTINPAQINVSKNVNYGHVLLENGGLDSWEYNGKLVENLTGDKNPDQGLLLRKNYFKDTIVKNEINYGSQPYLTVNDKKLLAELNIEYSDKSGVGNLTSEEWKILGKNTDEKQTSLSNTSQFDYIELQKFTGSFHLNNDFTSTFIKNARETAMNAARF